MAIHSFLKAEKGDPDWQFSPEDYIGKEFKIIDANMVELNEDRSDTVVLRQTPTEKELLAKHLKISLQKNSTLEMTIINDADSNHQQVFLYDVYLKPGSHLLLSVFVKDGKLNKHIFQVHQEDNSAFTSYGIISNNVGGDSEVIIKMLQQGENTVSNQIFAGIAGENSQTVYQSVAVMDTEAFYSEAGIENNNLVIGFGGRCYSKIETYVNAEFASGHHSSNTDTIHMDNIRYLSSKGIPMDVARETVIKGFRHPIVDLIMNPSIKQEIQELYSSSN